MLNSLGKTPTKILSKETLNHRGLIAMSSGIDPLKNTPEAYKRAYEALGIDFINRVPIENCPNPLVAGTSVNLDENYKLMPLGVYDSYYRYHYPYADVDDFLEIEYIEELDYHKLNTPVPHTLTSEDITQRESAIGDIGYYYYQLYTTLFMWGIEYLGWEVAMMAIALDPKFYDKYFLTPAFRQSLELTDILVKTESPYVFFHDDLATATGLACHRDWMKEYIFPRYPLLWEKVHVAGKKVIFVCDGNVSSILHDIKESGVDGVMLENPATPFEKILDVFDEELVIGGIDTTLLTNCTKKQVEKHVLQVAKMTQGRNFAFSSCGGIHDGIPIENLEAYFDTRADVGVNRRDWRFCDK